MKQFIVYNQEGKILRNGSCGVQDFFQQAEDREFVMEGKANDVTQKIVNIGIEGKVVNKTLKEIEAEKPPVIPPKKKPAVITKEQWQDVLDRLSKVEAEK